MALPDNFFDTIDSNEPAVGFDPKGDIHQYNDIFDEAADMYGIPASLVKAVAKLEWGGTPNETSHTNNKGVMQLSDSLINQYDIKNPYDPFESIMGGARYLAELRDTFGGIDDRTIAAYQAGPGKVKREGITNISDGITTNSEYVQKVKANWEKYKAPEISIPDDIFSNMPDIPTQSTSSAAPLLSAQNAGVSPLLPQPQPQQVPLSNATMPDAPKYPIIQGGNVPYAEALQNQYSGSKNATLSDVPRVYGAQALNIAGGIIKPNEPYEYDAEKENQKSPGEALDARMRNELATAYGASPTEGSGRIGKWVSEGLFKLADKLATTKEMAEIVRSQLKGISSDNPDVANALARGNIGMAIGVLGGQAALRGDQESADAVMVLRDDFKRAVNETPDKTNNAFLKVVNSVVEMAPGMIKGGGYSMIPGVGPTMGATMWALEGGGSVYTDLLEEGVDKDAARDAAMVVGPIYAAIEKMQVGQVFNTTTGKAAKEAVKKTLLKGVKKFGLNWLQDGGEKTVLKAIRSGVADYGIDWLKEVNEEGLQSLTQSIGKDAARGTAAGETIGNAFSEYGTAVKESAAPLALMGAPAKGVGVLKSVRDVQQSRKDEEAAQAALGKKLTEFNISKPADFWKLNPVQASKTFKQLRPTEQDLVLESAKSAEGVNQKNLNTLTSFRDKNKQQQSSIQQDPLAVDANEAAQNSGKSLVDLGVATPAEFFNLPKEEQEELFGQLSQRQQDYVIEYDPEDPTILESRLERARTDNDTEDRIAADYEVVPDKATINTDPSEAQKKAGNYKLAHVKLNGMDVSIETAAGEFRRGEDDNKKQWEQKMFSDYGYIKGSVGYDKDHLDVMVKPGGEKTATAYVVNQLKPSGEFDEHKVMIGYDSEEDARKGYLASYEKGWEKNVDSIVPMAMDQFKEWAYSDGPRKGKLEPKSTTYVEPVPSSKPVLESVIKKQNKERKESSIGLRAILGQMKVKSFDEFIALNEDEQAKRFQVVDEIAKDGSAKGRVFSDGILELNRLLELKDPIQPPKERSMPTMNEGGRKHRRRGKALAMKVPGVTFTGVTPGIKTIPPTLSFRVESGDMETNFEMPLTATPKDIAKRRDQKLKEMGAPLPKPTASSTITVVEDAPVSKIVKPIEPGKSNEQQQPQTTKQQAKPVVQGPQGQLSKQDEGKRRAPDRVKVDLKRHFREDQYTQEYQQKHFLTNLAIEVYNNLRNGYRTRSGVVINPVNSWFSDFAMITDGKALQKRNTQLSDYTKNYLQLIVDNASEADPEYKDFLTKAGLELPTHIDDVRLWLESAPTKKEFLKYHKEFEGQLSLDDTMQASLFDAALEVYQNEPYNLTEDQRTILEDTFEQDLADITFSDQTEDLFKDTEFEDTRTETQKEIDAEISRKKEKTQKNDKGVAELPLFDKNEQEAMAAKQENLFEQKAPSTEELVPQTAAAEELPVVMSDGAVPSESNNQVVVTLMKEAVEKKDYEKLLSSLSVLENTVSRKTFESLTGVKLPKTRKGTRDAIRSFVGEDIHDKYVSDNEKTQKDKKDSEEKASRAAIIKEVNRYTIKSDGKITTLPELIKDGWSIEEYKVGFSTRYRLRKENFTIDFKPSFAKYLYEIQDVMVRKELEDEAKANPYTAEEEKSIDSLFSPGGTYTPTLGVKFKSKNIDIDDVIYSVDYTIGKKNVEVVVKDENGKELGSTTLFENNVPSDETVIDVKVSSAANDIVEDSQREPEKTVKPETKKTVAPVKKEPIPKTEPPVKKESPVKSEPMSRKEKALEKFKEKQAKRKETMDLTKEARDKKLNEATELLKKLGESFVKRDPNTLYSIGTEQAQLAFDAVSALVEAGYLTFKEVALKVTEIADNYITYREFKDAIEDAYDSYSEVDELVAKRVEKFDTILSEAKKEQPITKKPDIIKGENKGEADDKEPIDPALDTVSTDASEVSPTTRRTGATRKNGAAAAKRGGGGDTGPDGKKTDTARSTGDGNAKDIGTRTEVSEFLSPIEIPSKTNANTSDYIISDEDFIGDGSVAQKAEQTLNATVLLKKLQAENRTATPSEQKILAKFSGWGPLSGALNENIDDVGYSFRGISKKLREVLTPQEFQDARESRRNSHYTAVNVIKGMWDGLKRLGLNGGRVLEPATGVGSFIGLRPQNIPLQLFGVEKDLISAQIAQQLYQGAQIENKPYEEYDLKENFFDVIISNVPFLQTTPYDRNHKKYGMKPRAHSLHNFFFVKSLHGVRPGGVVAFITTHYTLDATTKKDHLHAITKKANLIGAVRLPNNAFKGVAKTEVVTDIIFLQKKAPGEATTELTKSMLQTGVVSTAGVVNSRGDTVPTDQFINRYFINNPHMVLGEHYSTGSMYRADEYTVRPREGDLGKQLKDALATLPANILDARKAFERSHNEQIDNAIGNKDVPIGGYYIENGKVYQNEADVTTGKAYSVATAVSAENLKRISALVKLKDKALSVFKYQVSENDKDIEEQLKELRAMYDSFVANYGVIHSRENAKIILKDPYMAILKGLENYDAAKNKATKSNFLLKPIIKAAITPESVDSVEDGYIVSLSERGRVDIDYIASITKKSPGEVTKELLSKKIIYEDAESFLLDGETGNYEERENYLSGNVRKKLKAARQAAEKDIRFAANVEDLLEVQPKEKGPGEISVRINSPIVSETDLNDFITETIFDGERTSTKVYRNVETGAYTVTTTADGRNSSTNKTAGVNWTESGENAITGTSLLELALNDSPIVIQSTYKDELGEKVTIIDEQATELARGKAEKLKEDFGRWVWTDQERTERIAREFNDRYNNITNRTYTHPARIKNPDAPVQLPGCTITLRPHQTDAVWRGIQNPTTMLAHEVGAGKTFVCICTAMELKRLGIRKKNVIVVPNHLANQWNDAVKQAYPGANVLTATDENFTTPSDRKVFLNRAALGDFDIVILRQTHFATVQMNPQLESEFLAKQLEELKAELKRISEFYFEDKGGTGRSKTRGEKAISNKIDNFKSRMAQLMDMKRDEGVPYFDEMGFDQIFVDEADEYKNLAYTSSIQGVLGMGSKDGSKRALDLFMKSRHILANSGGMIMATGTPISNSLVEAYSMMRYLQEPFLNDNGLKTFDQWARMFAVPVRSYEQSSSGNGLIARTRYSQYNNVQEIISHLSETWDVIDSQFLNESGILKEGVHIPKVNRFIIETEISPNLADYMDHLADREEAIRNRKGPPEKGMDILPVVTMNGKMAAIDLRIINKNIPEETNSKLNTAIDKAIELTKKYPTKAGVIFYDMTSPKKGKKAQQDVTFQVHAEIKRRLIESGLKPEEVAIIHDYKKDDLIPKLFKPMQEGKIKVLIGSTPKMGAGTEIQKNLKWLFHIDAPYRPRDIIQREGRIIRQGNENLDGVEIYTFITKGSLDSGAWELLSKKAKLISSVMSRRDKTITTLDEGDQFDQTSVAAILNPLMQERAQVQQEVKKLKNLAQATISEQYVAQRSLRATHADLENYRKELPAHQKILDKLPPRPEGDEIEITVHDSNGVGTVYKSRSKAIAAIKEILPTLNAAQTADGQHLLTYAGFKGYAKPHVKIYSTDEAGTFDTTVHTTNGYGGLRRIAGYVKESGFIRDIFSTLYDMPAREMESLNRLIERAVERQKALAKKLEIPIESFNAQIDDAEKRLAEITKELDIDLDKRRIEREAQKSLRVGGAINWAQMEAERKQRVVEDDGKEALSEEPSNAIGFSPVRNGKLMLRFEEQSARGAEIENRLYNIKFGEATSPLTKDDITVLGKPTSAELRMVEDVVQSLSGKEVVLVQTTENFYNKTGFYIDGFTFPKSLSPDLANKVFIDVNSDRPVLWVAGHEMYHFIEQDKALKSKFWDSVQLTDQGLAELAKNGESELAADIVGEMFTQKEFWENLHLVDKTSFEKIVRRLLTVLSKIVETARKYLTGSGKNENSFVVNAVAARNTVAEIFATYKTKQGNVHHSDIAFEQIAAAIRAYHGSQYQFDQFRIDQIGTGEGAQIFGWGLYFSSSKKIADWYRGNFFVDKNLVATRIIKENDDLFQHTNIRRDIVPRKITVNGKALKKSKLSTDDLAMYNNLLKWLQTTLKPIPQLIPILKNNPDAINKKLAEHLITNSVKVETVNLDNYLSSNYLKKWKTTYSVSIGSQGSNPNLIKYDDQISKSQAQQLKDYLLTEKGDPAIKKMIDEGAYLELLDTLQYQDGKDLYNLLKLLLRSDKDASLFLNRAGFDGIDYPAGTISGEKTEERNYVIFDDSIISIDKKDTEDINYAKRQRSTLPSPDVLEVAKENVEEVTAQTKELERQIASLRGKLLHMKDHQLLERAQLGIQIRDMKADRFTRVKSAVMQYAKKIGLNGVPYNKVAVLVKNATTTTNLKKAVQVMDEVWQKALRRDMVEELLTTVEREYRTLRAIETGKIKSNRTADANIKMKQYLDSLSGNQTEVEEKIRKILNGFTMYGQKDAKVKDAEDLPPSVNEWLDKSSEPVPSKVKDLIKGMFKAAIPTMSTEEIAQVIEDIESIKETGKTLKEIETALKKEQLEKDAAEVISVISSSTKTPSKSKFAKATEKKRLNPLQYTKKLAVSGFWSHIDAERIVEWLTGWTNYGTLKDMLLEKLYDAERVKIANAEEAIASFQERHKDIDFTKLDTVALTLDMKEIYDIANRNSLVSLSPPKNMLEPIKLTYDNCMFIYANSKNEGNRSHLEGFFENSVITDEVIERATKALSPEHIEAVDAQIEYYDNSQWSRVNTVFKESVGVELPKEANYFPIQLLDTDRAESAVIADFMARQGSRYASVRKGMTKGRVQSKAPFKEASYLNTVMRNSTQVEHYIAYDAAIRDAEQVLRHPGIRAVITEKSPDAYKELQNYLAAVAYGKIGSSENPFDKAADYLRGNFAKYALALKVTTALTQISSLPKGLAFVEAGSVLKTASIFLRNPVKTMQFVDKISAFMRVRASNYERELAEFAEKQLAGRYSGVQSVSKKAQEWAMWHIGAVDKVVASVIWYSKYSEQIKKGVTEESAMRLADELIRKTQSRGGVLFMPSVYRGGGLVRAYTMFTSDLNQNLNLGFEMIGKAKFKPTSKTAVEAFWVFFVSSYMVYLVRNAGDPDDWEELAKEMVSDLTGGVAFLGQLIEASVGLATDRIKEARGLIPDKRWKNFVADITPTSFEGIKSLAEGIAYGSGSRLLESLAMFTGIPIRTINTFIKGARELPETKDPRRLIYPESRFRPESKDIYAAMSKRAIAPRPGTEDRQQYAKWRRSLSEEEKEAFNSYIRQYRDDYYAKKRKKSEKKRKQGS